MSAQQSTSEGKPMDQLAETQSLANSDNRLLLAQNMTEEELFEAEKKLRCKLDSRLLLTMWFIFVLNYLDRNNIAAAKVAGVAKSLDLSANQYSTAVALLFVGYILMQIPSNVFLAHIRPSLYLPGCMAVWGVLSLCTGLVHNAAGLYTTRFFLGFVEAAFYLELAPKSHSPLGHPALATWGRGSNHQIILRVTAWRAVKTTKLIIYNAAGALFLISSWYKRSEMGFRSALLFSATQVGSAFSGLIGAGIQSSLDGARGLESWRWLFIIEGSVTVFIALCSLAMLPDWPSTTRWLTPTERAVAEWRPIRDAGQVDEDDERWGYGFKLTFKDWRVYVFCVMLLCIQVASATSNFFPSVVETLGYGRVKTLLLTAPPYFLGMTISIVNNYSADRLQNSSFHIMWPMALSIIGFVVGASATAEGPRYFAMMLMIGGGHGSNAVLVAWAQKTMLRPRIKRASAVAFINAVGNTSQVWTSYLYPDAAQPRYVLAMSVNSAFALVVIILAGFMRMVLLRANKKLDQGASVAEVMKGEAQAKIQGLSQDEARARKQAFRYVA